MHEFIKQWNLNADDCSVPIKVSAERIAWFLWKQELGTWHVGIPYV